MLMSIQHFDSPPHLFSSVFHANSLTLEEHDYIGFFKLERIIRPQGIESIRIYGSW